MHDKKKKSISKNSTSSLVPPSRNVSLTEQAALLSPASSLEIAPERSIFHIPSFLSSSKIGQQRFCASLLPPFLPPFSSGIVIPLYCGSGMSPVKSWTSHVAATFCEKGHGHGQRFRGTEIKILLFWIGRQFDTFLGFCLTFTEKINTERFLRSVARF